MLSLNVLAIFKESRIRKEDEEEERYHFIRKKDEEDHRKVEWQYCSAIAKTDIRQSPMEEIGGGFHR